MKQTESRRGAGATAADTRPARQAEGTSVRLDDGTIGRVFDASQRRQVDPESFIESAVRGFLGDGDGNAQISVQGVSRSGTGGRVRFGAQSTRILEQAAGQRDQTVNELVRGAVSQVADSVRARDERERQSAKSTGTGPVLPLADPLGLIEAATNGMFADPLAQMLRGQASPGRSRRGGGRVR
jgi:hypothetical protein